MKEILEIRATSTTGAIMARTRFSRFRRRWIIVYTVSFNFFSLSILNFCQVWLGTFARTSSLCMISFSLWKLVTLRPTTKSLWPLGRKNLMTCIARSIPRLLKLKLLVSKKHLQSSKRRLLYVPLFSDLLHEIDLHFFSTTRSHGIKETSSNF